MTKAADEPVVFTCRNGQINANFLEKRIWLTIARTSIDQRGEVNY